MTLVVACVLIVCQAILLLPRASGQERLYLQISCRNCGSVISLAADSLQRDLSRARHNPVVQAKGNVVVRMRVSGVDANASAYMMLSADAVTYHEDSGEMQPSGNGRIAFHTTEPVLAVG